MMAAKRQDEKDFAKKNSILLMSAIRRRHAAQGTAVEVTLQSDSNASSIPSSKTQDLTNQRLASVFLAVIATAIYANTLTAEFCYDDTFAIVNNKDVTGANPLSAIWTHDFWGQNITKVFLLPDQQYFPLSAYIYVQHALYALP